MSKTFILVAHARTGSTFICQKMGELSEADVYFELFHNDVEQTRRFLGDKAGAVWERFTPLADGDLRAYLAAHPLELLAFLDSLDPQRDRIFKLFPTHMSAENERAVLQESAGVMLLQRNLLHSFVSHEIALQTQKWVNDDTSDQKVAFDPRKFTNYVRHVAAFYDRVEAALDGSGIPRTEFHYEDIVIRPDRVDELLSSVLRSVGVPLAAGERPEGATLRRQDRRPLASDKVSNPDELLAFLGAAGLEAVNDGRTAMSAAQFREALATPAGTGS